MMVVKVVIFAAAMWLAVTALGIALVWYFHQRSQEKHEINKMREERDSEILSESRLDRELERERER